jgi:hypothetical protein
VSRVGLNLISQHIKLRGKTNKYAFFGLLQLILENWGHFQAKFHLQYMIYSTVHKAASSQISYVSYYTMLTNDSRSKTLICVTINFTYHIGYFISIWVQETIFLNYNRLTLQISLLKFVFERSSLQNCK